jgi:hypothetical protein
VQPVAPQQLAPQATVPPIDQPLMPQMTPNVMSPAGVPMSPGSPVEITNGARPPYAIPGYTNWIRRDGAQCPSCLGPWGGDPLIGQELYLRGGASFPLGGTLGSNLAPGFTVQLGARTLFFNQTYTAAWVVDTGIQNTFNSGKDNGDTFRIPADSPLGLPITVPVTVREVNRTSVNLGAGREWFVYPALYTPAHIRYGVDFGGRWGSTKTSFNEAGSRTDVFGTAYFGGHALYEFPFRDTIVNFGVRGEYNYTWSDVLNRSSDISEANILLSAGVRY